MFDWMMQIGSFIFSKIKKNQQHNRVFHSDQTVIFSKELLTFAYVSDTLTYSKFEDLKINPSFKYELVFDIQSFSFYEIINYMNTVRAINITFKMFLPESNFLIGSNNANDRGVIINLSKIE
jgi:hypothetical protein